MIYFTTSLIMLYVAMFIYGFGITISFSSVFRNGWKFFPDHKGKVTGIILFCFGLSSTIFNFLATRIINPQGKQATIIIGNDHYYDTDVTQNLKKFMLILIVIYLFMGIVSILLISTKFENEPKLEKLIGINEEISIQNDTITRNTLNSKNLGNNSNSKSKSKQFVDAFLSRKFWSCLIMASLNSFFLYMMSNINKKFGIQNNLSEGILNFVVTIFPIFNGIGRFGMGALADSFSFKSILSGIFIIDLGVSATIFFIRNQGVLYALYNVIIATTFGGQMCIIPNFIGKIFGQELSLELFGIIQIFYGLSNIVNPFVEEAIVKKTDDYFFLFMICSFCSLASVILILIFEEEEFEYKRDRPSSTDIVE